MYEYVDPYDEDLNVHVRRICRSSYEVQEVISEDKSETKQHPGGC